MRTTFSLGGPDRRLSIAPMMDCTDRHCRYFLRLISRRALLYTEMITTGAILRGNRERLLAFDPREHPVALQLGGADPDELAECARIAEVFGYDEVNLNLGCPSDRVQSARFGACLMAEPALVARAVKAMIAATRLPVTVKTRIGIDHLDSKEALTAFVRRLADAGGRSFAIHARKAWLRGLSPKENREIPPLRYERVYALKADNPDLEIVLNGGIGSLDQAAAHLARVDGVMIGRIAYRNPYMLAEADRRIFGDPRSAPSRAEVIEALLPYVDRATARGLRLHAITRHVLGLFQGVPGARAWRRQLSAAANHRGAGADVIRAALALLPASVRRGEPNPADRAAAPALEGAACARKLRAELRCP